MDKYLKTVTKDCTDTLKLLADVTSFIETYIDQKGAKRLLSKLNTQQKALEDLNDYKKLYRNLEINNSCKFNSS